MIGSLTLSEYPGNLVRLSCAKCGRSGQYWKQNLIEHYGADISLPHLREEIAQCGISAFASYRARRGNLNQAIAPISGTRWIDGGDLNQTSQAGLRRSGVSSKEA
jgi:hypothetical protein